MKPLSRGRLIYTRPPLSNAFGHPWRRLTKPSDGQGPKPGDDQPGTAGEPREEPNGPLPAQGPTQDLIPGEDKINPGETPDGEPDGEPVETSEFELDELPALPARLPGLTHQDSRLIVREFDSFYDFVTCAADHSLRKWGTTVSCQSSRGPDHSTPWYASASMEDAVDMALHRGWPEGRKLLSTVLAQVITQPIPFRSQSYDVGGAYPSVPAYCAGDPACMIEFQNNHILSRPVVSVDYKCNASASIKAQSIMFYGAAMLSLVLELEALGYSVELRITSDISAFIGPSLRTSFIYKRAGENLDIDRAAFAIAHPSVLRRFTFAIEEQHQELRAGYQVGYGSPATLVHNENDLTIKIPALHRNIDATAAKQLVSTAASAFLNRKDLAA
jgi:hypothetical protein